MKDDEVKARQRLSTIVFSIAHWLGSNRRLALFVEFAVLFLLFGELDRMIQLATSPTWGHPSLAEVSFRNWLLLAVVALLLVTLALIGFTVRVLDTFSATRDGVSMASNRQRREAGKKLANLDEQDALADEARLKKKPSRRIR